MNMCLHVVCLLMSVQSPEVEKKNCFKLHLSLYNLFITPEVHNVCLPATNATPNLVKKSSQHFNRGSRCSNVTNVRRNQIPYLR